MADAPRPSAWTPDTELPALPDDAARAAIEFIEGMPGNLGPAGYASIVSLWERVIAVYNDWERAEKDVRPTLLVPVFECLLSQLPGLVPEIINAEKAVELARHILTACEITGISLADDAYAPIVTLAPGQPLEPLTPSARDRSLTMPNPSWGDLSSMYRGQLNSSMRRVIDLLSPAEFDKAIDYYDEPGNPMVSMLLANGFDDLWPTLGYITQSERALWWWRFMAPYLRLQTRERVGVWHQTLFGEREARVKHLVEALVPWGDGAPIDGSGPIDQSAVRGALATLREAVASQTVDQPGSLQARAAAAVDRAGIGRSGDGSRDWQRFELAVGVVVQAARPLLLRSLPAVDPEPVPRPAYWILVRLVGNIGKCVWRTTPSVSPPRGAEAGALALIRFAVLMIWTEHWPGSKSPLTVICNLLKEGIVPCIEGDRVVGYYNGQQIAVGDIGQVEKGIQ